MKTLIKSTAVVMAVIILAGVVFTAGSIAVGAIGKMTKQNFPIGRAFADSADDFGCMVSGLFHQPGTIRNEVHYYEFTNQNIPVVPCVNLK